MSRLLLGIQSVREAIRVHGDKLQQVLVEERGGPQLEALARFATDQGIKVGLVPRADLDRIARGGRHQGTIATAPDLALWALDRLVEADGSSLLVALDELQDPQNFGAVIRSSVAFGAGGILWPEHSSAPLSPSTFRASAGAIERARLCRVSSLVAALGELAARGYTIVGLDAHAPVELSQCDLLQPTVLVVGSEGGGLRKSVKRACTWIARLPMDGNIDSLNASVATAVALYDAVRQRGTSKKAPTTTENSP